MKRFLLFLMCVAFLLISLAACGSPDENTPNQNPGTSSTPVDIDLTKGDSSSQYQRCVDIKSTFDTYTGKTVRLRGMYVSDKYQFILISDVTACCSIDFEIIYNGTLPKQRAEIMIEGTFDYYTDSEGSWPYIRVSSLSVIA